MVDQKQCLFCRIIKGEIPAKKVYEGSGSLAFLDINPRNPGHTLVIPKRHYETLFDLPDGEMASFFSTVKKVASQVKEAMQAHGLSVCQNNGSAAGQVVAHLHVHLIPRFLNEGPAALEAMLPVKKMDDASMDKIASTISEAPSRPTRRREPEPEHEPREKPTPLLPPEMKETKKPVKKKKDAPPKEEENDIDEFEEINFNF